MRPSAEHGIQVAYFDWVRFKQNSNPDYHLIFSVPNGSKLPYTKKFNPKTGKVVRFSSEAMWLKDEGLKPGVADVLILLPNHSTQTPYACIEFKAGKNKQTEEQLQFQKLVEKVGGEYWLCRSFEDAKDRTFKYIEGRIWK